MVFEISFFNENTVLIKSSDGLINDTLRDIEEISFDDALFTVDYENKTLIKKVEYKDSNEVDEVQNDQLLGEKITSGAAAAAIATAAMVGTVAASVTQESSSEEVTYLSDASNDNEAVIDTVIEEENKIHKLSEDDSIFELVSKIKEYKQVQNNNTYEEINNVQIEENSDNTTLVLNDDTSNVNTDIVDLNRNEVQAQAEETPIVVQAEVEEDELPILLPPSILFEVLTIKEDTFIFDMKINNPNSNSSMQVIFTGIPDDAYLSAGEKRSDGTWLVTQNDLLDLKLFPGLHNANDFDISVHAIVVDIHGRVIDAVYNERIIIEAVADIPNFEVQNDAYNIEDTAIALNITTSLVDTLGGPDGEESIIIGIENVPFDAVLSAGKKDSEGVWYLIPQELENLTITPGLHKGDDFTIKVTSYTIESENNDIASISEEILVEVYAIADIPELETANAAGLEDTQIFLDISTDLVDKDQSEILKLKIENVPEDAVLNHGEKDENGIWFLEPSDLAFLTITPKEHDAQDFTIKVTAYTRELENNDLAEISKDILVEVQAVADKVIINTLQTFNGSEDLIVGTEDSSIVYFDLSSSFIDEDGSESIHYIIEGLPEDTRLNKGVELEEGKWKLSVGDLENIGLFLKENSDENFRIKVSAITTEEENNHQEITTKFLDVHINSVADFANLSVSNTSGLQNDFISLDIASSLVDNDGSESLSIMIAQVPDDAILNKGSKDEDGNWHLSKDDLVGLSIRPKFNSLDDFELKVKVTTLESKNGDTQENVAYIKVDVQPIPSVASLSVNATNILEDETCFLEIAVDESALNPGESIYLELKVPPGFTLSSGELINENVWKLKPEQLANLELNTLPNYAGSLSIDIVTVITESNGKIRTSDIVTKLPIDIEAVADEATLEVSDIQNNEDTLVYLNIAAQLSDLDGSESLHLHIKGVPQDAILNAGEKIDGVWIVDEKDIKTLAVYLKENMSGTFDLEIEAKSTDSNNHSTSVIKTVSVVINEVIDEAILHVSDSYIKAGKSTLGIQALLQDLDGSESLSIEISGVPSSANLSAGVKNIDGTYSLLKNELEDLIITGLNEETSLVVKAISSNGSQVKSVEKNILIKPLENNDDPFISISQLNIQSDSYMASTLIGSGSSDTIFAGGGNDKIYSNGGADVIYGDEAQGIISTSFQLDVSSFKTDNSEDLFIKIENLPENFTSNVGYVSNGILIIEAKDFDGNVLLGYPYTSEKVSLNIVLDAISNDIFNAYTKTTNLRLEIQAKEIAGNDFIDAGKGNDTVYAQEGDDIVLGGDGNDILFGGDGNDYINGGDGADKIFSGKGDDNIIMDAQDFENTSFINDVIDAGEGFDTLVIDDDKGVNFDMALSNVEHFTGGSGNDNIIGSDKADIVIGGKGADTFYTLDGDDTVYIDAADIQAQAGNFVDTGAGNDTIYIQDSAGVEFDVSDTNAETIISGSGNDVLKNNTSEEVKIYGMQGNDRIYSSSSIDILDGGEGIDTIDYSNSTVGVNVDIENNIVSGGYANNDVISNFENVKGSLYDDNIIGSSTDNIIDAGEGNNTVDGLGGEDTVVFKGSLREYYNGADIKNIVTNFDQTASVITDTGINELTNISKLQFDDYTVHIDGTNNSPFVYNDVVNTTEDTTLLINASTLLENDFDLEGSALKIVGLAKVNNGNAVLNSNGTITFDAYDNYNSSTNNTFDRNSALYKGGAGFEYIVEDEDGARRTAYVNVEVSAVNDAPTISSHYFSRNGRTTGHGKIVLDDIDSNVSSLNVSVISSLAYNISYQVKATRTVMIPNYSGDGDGDYQQTYYKHYSFNRTGYVNISGRTPDDDGVFHFDYRGSVIKGHSYDTGKKDLYDMRPFTLRITDDGDVNGSNVLSATINTGSYYHAVRHDPVMIDLDGDGIELSEKYYEVHDKILTGVSADDAVLVWDYNQDGSISSGLETSWVELSQTATNDLDVLREVFDTNKDGFFDENDEEWENFALWQDKNEDGLVSDDEFTKISQSQILKLNLEIDKSIEAFSPIEEYASYTDKDGNKRSIAAGYLDTTSTEDKLSSEDLLIINEAAVLNEQLAAEGSVLESFVNHEDSSNILFDENDNIEENIA